MSPRSLVLTMCLGQIGSLLPHMAFSALIPGFSARWQISAAECGAIAGGFFLGYAMVVPVAATLTDRLDARRILIAGSLLSSAATIAFGMLAEGFWSALALWTLAGAGFAGAYMPGLRALTDRLPAGDPSRSITLFTSSYSIGVGLSFLLAQLLDLRFGWRIAFIVLGLGPLLMLVIAMHLRDRKPEATSAIGLLEFGPVLRNRQAMGFIIGYGAHCFELAAVRAWIVSFWIYVAATRSTPGWIDAIAVSVMVTLLAMPASIAGNELAIRFGRHRLIRMVMVASALVAIGLALAAQAPWPLVLGLLLLQGLTIPADSGSLTAGMMASAQPGFRGATMAVHSTLGFATSFIGPLAVGLALDAAGGPTQAEGWQSAFGMLAIAAVAGLPWLRSAVSGRPPGPA
jgi:MFS family permease